MMTVAPLFRLSDVIGDAFFTQFGGDALKTLTDALSLVDVTGAMPTYSGTIAIDTASDPVPIIGDDVKLDFASFTGTGQPAAQTDDGARGFTRVATITATLTPPSISITTGANLWFSPDLLQPTDNSDAVRIPLAQVTLTIGKGITVILQPGSLPSCQLGSSGVMLQSASVNLAVGGSQQPAGVDPNFRGLVIQNLGFTLPSDLDQGGETLSFKKVLIGSTGVSASANIPLGGASMSLFGAAFNAEQLAIDVERSSLASAQITGTLTLPFFDQDIDVVLGIGDGGWTLSLATSDLSLAIPSSAPLLILNLDALGIERRDGETWFKVSGTVQLNAPQGFESLLSNIPSLTLRDVLINSHGEIKAAGGMMALSSQQMLKIGDVFSAKLTHFGLGRDDQYQFITFSGEIDLVAGLNLKGTFQDLQFCWGNGTTLRFKEIDVRASEAGVFAIDGSVDFVTSGAAPPGTPANSARPPSEHGFTGRLSLQIESVGLELDLQCAIIEVGGTPSFAALFFTFDLKLPVGIPLWTTGLAIYGFDGLLAWHYHPADQTTQALPTDWVGWYTGAPGPGATQLIKWAPASALEAQDDVKGIGAGITLATLPDVGFSLHARTTLVVLVPGPIFILDGSLNFIELPEGLDDATATEQGTFDVIIVYDGNAETLTLGIDANFSEDPVISLTGTAAAYFDFLDATKWYLHVGTKAKPFQAQAIKIFNASAYFDIDSNQIVLGAQAGFNQDYHFGPLEAKVAIGAATQVTVVYRPGAIDGMASLNGDIKLSAFGLGVDLAIDVDLAIQVITAVNGTIGPWWRLRFEIDAELKINLLFTSADLKAQISVTVESPTASVRTPPVLALTGLSLDHGHSALQTQAALQPVRNSTGVGSGPAAVMPAQSDLSLVPPDCMPTLQFCVALNDTWSGAQNAPQGIGAVSAGNSEYTYTLTEVTITNLGQGLSGGTPFAGAITGAWSSGTGSRTFQMWTESPYFLTRFTTPQNRSADVAALTGPSPCTTVSYTPKEVCVSATLFPVLQFGSATMVRPTTAVRGLSSDPTQWMVCDERMNGAVLIVGKANRMGFASGVGKIVIWFLSGFLDDVPHPGDIQFLDAGGNAASGTTVISQVNGTVLASLTFTTSASVVSMFFDRRFDVLEICYVTTEEFTRQSAARAIAQSQMANLSNPAQTSPSVRPVFLPWTNYQVTITTTAVDESGNTSTFTDCAYFRTAGPPGFRLPADRNPSSQAYPNSTALSDLSTYIGGTVPASDAVRIANGRYEPTYRGYDPAVVFNEGYVPQMYDDAAIDLDINVVEFNNAPLVANGTFQDVHRTPLYAGARDGGGTLQARTQIYAPDSRAQSRRGGTWGRAVGMGHNTPDRTRWAGLVAKCKISQHPPPDSAAVLPLDPRAALAPQRKYQLQLSGVPRATAQFTSSVILCRSTFTTSRFLTMTHQLQSFPGIVFAQSGTTAASMGLGAALPVPATGAPDAVEDTAYQALLAAAGLTPLDVETLDITSLLDAGGNVNALFVQTPEPVPWDRIALSGVDYALGAPPLTRARTGKISDIVPGTAGYVEIILLTDGDISTWSLSSDAGVVYSFAGEGVWPGGTVFRVLGSSSVTAAADIQVRTGAVVPSSATKLTLSSGTTTLHTLPLAGTFVSGGVVLTRALTGTAFFVRFTDAQNMLAAFPSATLRFSWLALRDIGDPTRIWTRDGDSTEESTRLWVAPQPKWPAVGPIAKWWSRPFRPQRRRGAKIL